MLAIVTGIEEANLKLARHGQDTNRQLTLMATLPLEFLVHATYRITEKLQAGSINRGSPPSSSFQADRILYVPSMLAFPGGSGETI